MNCSICDKQFSNKSNLIRHQKNNVCSRLCSSCNIMYPTKTFTKHESECPAILKRKYIEIEKEYIHMKDKFEAISRRCNELECDNKKYKKQILGLAKKAVKQKQPIINVNQNITIDNLQVLDFNDFSKYANQLTIEHIKKGVSGYAEFALAYPLQNKIVCTDFARRKIRYKTTANQLANDYNFNIIGSKLFSSIDSQNRKEILDYGNNYIQSIKDPEEKMRLYSKFITYIDMVRDGSTGSLFPEFVKEICSKSHST